MHLRRLAAIAALIWPTISLAAEFSTYETDDATIVVVTGRLLMGDDVKFRQVTARITRGVVLLGSDGGSLWAGMGIGRIIKDRRFATWVSTLHGRCASACGFAWLAGETRILDSGSLVGFHAASINSAGKQEISGAANALAGAYMFEIGMSEKIIEYATTARPDSMQWLSAADIARLNLSVKYVSSSFGAAVDKRKPKIPVPEAAPRERLGVNRVKIIRVKPGPKTEFEENFLPNP